LTDNANGQKHYPACLNVYSPPEITPALPTRAAGILWSTTFRATDWKLPYHRRIMSLPKKTGAGSLISSIKVCMSTILNQIETGIRRILKGLQCLAFCAVIGKPMVPFGEHNI